MLCTWSRLQHRNGGCWSSGTTPPTAPTTGLGLVQLLQLPAAPVGHLAEAGLQKETRAAHRRALTLLAAMSTRFQAMPLGLALTEWMDLQRKEKSWCWSTMMKYLASSAGALSSLPLYRATMVQVQLSRDPFWRAALQSVAARARCDLPRQPTAATKTEILAAIRAEPDLQVRVMIALTWMLAGRVSDVQKLQKANVQVQDDGSVAVVYTQTNTSRATGVREVTTASWPPEWLQLLERWLASRHYWVFCSGTISEKVKIALRRINVKLECRSLRRGALTAMALAGVPTSTLRVYSGHTSERMLLVYLGWGQHHKETTTRTVTAGEALAPTTTPTVSSTGTASPRISGAA